MVTTMSHCNDEDVILSSLLSNNNKRSNTTNMERNRSVREITSLLSPDLVAQMKARENFKRMDTTSTTSTTTSSTTSSSSKGGGGVCCDDASSKRKNSVVLSACSSPNDVRRMNERLQEVVSIPDGGGDNDGDSDTHRDDEESSVDCSIDDNSYSDSNSDSEISLDNDVDDQDDDDDDDDDDDCISVFLPNEQTFLNDACPVLEAQEEVVDDDDDDGNDEDLLAVKVSRKTSSAKTTPAMERPRPTTTKRKQILRKSKSTDGNNARIVRPTSERQLLLQKQGNTRPTMSQRRKSSRRQQKQAPPPVHQPRTTPAITTRSRNQNYNRRGSMARRHSTNVLQTQLVQAIYLQDQVYEKQIKKEDSKKQSMKSNGRLGVNSSDHYHRDGDRIQQQQLLEAHQDQDARNNRNTKKKNKTKRVVQKAKGMFQRKRDENKSLENSFIDVIDDDNYKIDNSNASNSYDDTDTDIVIPNHLNLLIEIVAARNILIGDTTTSDPYVIVKFGDKKVHKTSKIMKT